MNHSGGVVTAVDRLKTWMDGFEHIDDDDVSVEMLLAIADRIEKEPQAVVTDLRQAAAELKANDER